MKQFNRFTVLMLASALLLSSCASENPENKEPDAAKNAKASQSAPAVETAPETEETTLTDNVPALNFEGVSVTMAGQGTKGGNNGLDMWVDEFDRGRGQRRHLQPEPRYC